MIGPGLENAFRDLHYTPGAVAVMRDGCRLVADIYTPAGPGPWPVLLMRQPYGRDIASTVVYAHPTWYARRGFMVVIQDVRGRGDSEGEFYPFRREIDDGFETVQWAAALPGSNGRVGMYGFSYQGSTQLLAALGRPPALKALAPHMTAFDLYSGWFYRGGLLQLSTTLGWANQMLREDARRRKTASVGALDEMYTVAGKMSTQFPIARADPITRPDLPTYAVDWLGHATPDEYWKEFDLLERVNELHLPMFHISGWYDLYLRGSIDGYTRMAKVRSDQFLLAAPWVHIPWGRHINGVDHGPEAVPNVDELQAAWFHHWLDHEAPSDVCPYRGVRYFNLGENRWHDAPSWPPPQTRDQTWYLRSGGRANSSEGDGTLDTTPGDDPDDLFNYDPEVPVLAPGGNHGGMAGFGPHDLTAQQQGLNLLVYTTPPFEKSVDLAGSARVHLFAKSSAPMTAFVARLSRVTTGGRAIFLTLGAARGKVDGTAPIELVLDSTACRIAAGERLRLDIASSAFPLLIREPNTGQDPASVAAPAEFRRALQIVYHDRARPSSLFVPVVPGSPS